MGYEERAPQPPIRQFGGLNVKDSEIGLPGNDSPFMVNVDLHPDDALKQRRGCTALDTPVGESNINAVMHLRQPENDRSWVYCLAGGLVYRTLDETPWSWEIPTCASLFTLGTQLSWGRAKSRYYDGATEHLNVLYLPIAGNPPLIALGQTSPIHDLVEMPAGSYGTGTPGSGATGYPSDWVGDWPTHMRIVGVGRGARMYAWGFPSNKSKLAYSEIDVPWNFMRSNVDDPSADPQPGIDGGYFIVRPGAGGEVVAVIDMFGYTVVLKRTRALIYTSDPGSSDHQVVADLPVGCVSDRAWVKVGNDIIFWAENGPRSLSAVQEYGDVQQNELAWKVNSLVKSALPANYERICCYHDPENERVVWFVPLLSSDHNDSAFVYYYRSGKWSKWDGQICEMMDVEHVPPVGGTDERLLGASYDKGIVEIQSGYSDLGEDIESDYYTNWINTGEVSDAARALFLDVFFGNQGPGVEIYYQVDFNDEWFPISRIERAFGGTGMAWGFFAWPEGAWGSSGKTFRRYELDALFNLIRFRFTKVGGAGWETMGYRIEARGKGART